MLSRHVTRLLAAWHDTLSRLARGPADDPYDRLLKTLLLGVVIGGTLFLLFWAAFYALLDDWAAVSIFLGYAALSCISLVVFVRHPQRFHGFSLFQFGGIFALSLALIVVRGGLISASAHIIWAQLALIGVLIFYGFRQALWWFAAFAAIIALTVITQPSLQAMTAAQFEMVQLMLGLNIITVTAFVIVAFYYFLDQRNVAYTLLRQEQQKSERLLLNILPKEIAAVLKDGERTIARHYDAVSILFADLVNFTTLSNALQPNELIELLNEIFLHFDALAEKYGVEKMRTIGDSYMAAAGVPRPRPDHAQALAHMALDICDYLRGVAPRAGQRIDFRVGISSGSVVAGVIGRKKFQYDVWGDAVNMASRMESHGVPGRIQITRATYELIKDEFVCEPRGMVQVKGKGEMETWFLSGVTRAPAAQPERLQRSAS